jgi:hypothetical protein
MITNRQRYEARHVQICGRAEREFAAGMTAELYVAAVHRAISKRDGTGIAAVLATMGAHLALQEDRRSRGVESIQYANPPFVSSDVPRTQLSPVGA